MKTPLLTLLVLGMLVGNTMAEDKGPMADPADKSLFDRVSEKITEKAATGEVGDFNTSGYVGEEHHATEDAQPGEETYVGPPQPVETNNE